MWIKAQQLYSVLFNIVATVLPLNLCFSDEETEPHLEEDKTKDGDYGNKGPESHRSVVGMKRAMEFESYSCHIK